MSHPAGEPPNSAGSLDPPDLAAPVAALPVCSTCGHLRIVHRRGRCRADVGPRRTCRCSRFTDPPGDPLGDGQDLDVSEAPPS